MNEIYLHCHLLYFSSIILSFGHCALYEKIRYTPSITITIMNFPQSPPHPLLVHIIIEQLRMEILKTYAL